MCGGSPKSTPPRVDPPPPDAPAELILSAKGAKDKGQKSGRKKLRAGRTSLVTPGLTTAAAKGGGSLGGAAKKTTV